MWAAKSPSGEKRAEFQLLNFRAACWWIREHHKNHLTSWQRCTVREWVHLKQVWQHSLRMTWSKVNTRNPDCSSNINTVVKLSHALPLSSSASERGISHLSKKTSTNLICYVFVYLPRCDLTMKTTKTSDKSSCCQPVDGDRQRLGGAYSSSIMQEAAVEDGEGDFKEEKNKVCYGTKHHLLQLNPA